MNSSIALGCSHTQGVGVEPHQAWPALMGIQNLGVSGVSADFCYRMLQLTLQKQTVEEVYILYPHWLRFEYRQDDVIFQSLPSDSNRIEFMETHDEAWCWNNYTTVRTNISLLCDAWDILLVEMTFEDMTGIINHADTWPAGSDGDHHGAQWHQWVAGLFGVKREWCKYVQTG